MSNDKIFALSLWIDKSIRPLWMWENEKYMLGIKFLWLTVVFHKPEKVG